MEVSDCKRLCASGDDVARRVTGEGEIGASVIVAKVSRCLFQRDDTVYLDSSTNGSMHDVFVSFICRVSTSRLGTHFLLASCSAC